MSWRVIAALIASLTVIAVLARRYRAQQKRVLEWPVVPASFGSGLVLRVDREGPVFRLNVQFLYRVGDSEHHGEYDREFRTEQEAIDLRRSLEQGPFNVRYNPLSPSDYDVDPYRDVWVPQHS